MLPTAFQSLRSVRLLTAAALAVLLAACAAHPPFESDIAGDKRPWTTAAFDAAPGKFTFAVFSDLNGGEREGVFEIAMRQLALLRPELILSVGDLIPGETEDPAEIDAQWASFDRRARLAKAPVFRVGGNHDLTGRTLQEAWDQHFGRRYYYFVYRNVLFLVLDTEDATPERAQQIFEMRNEGIRVMDEQGYEAFKDTDYFRLQERKTGSMTEAQADYFRRVLAGHPDVRWTFVFMHKPAWLREDFENFQAIEAALADRPYTVFAGHFHSYAHTLRHGRDYIRLATTGGAQGPGEERAVDEVALVTVGNDGVDIANLLLDGILDKTGHVPLGGDAVCFEQARCGGDARGQ